MTAIGTLGRYGAYELAERAAQHIVGYRSARALCIDGLGHVTLENPDSAIPADIVGVYAPVGGLAATYFRIREDLQYEAEARGVSCHRHKRGRAAE